MFTGLIEEVGIVTGSREPGDGREVQLRTEVVQQNLTIGDSLAVNGVCLTVVRIEGNDVGVEAVAETLRKSNLRDLRTGERVNLERALPVSARLGGHIVQGHVDCQADVSEVLNRQTGLEIVFHSSADCLRFAAPTGSVAVNGVSLTIAASGRDWLRVAVIPHTGSNTTLTDLQPGDRVNLEMDCIAKYTERLLHWREQADGTTEPEFDPALY